MNREIRFRAWTKNKTMVYNVTPFQWDYCIYTDFFRCIKSNGGGVLGSGGTEASYEVTAHSFVDGAIMQFTGLKDKNGKEIYENDVVLTTNRIKCSVEFREGGFYVKHPNGDYRPMITSFCKNWEVIGNIYEHPELLKEK